MTRHSGTGTVAMNLVPDPAEDTVRNAERRRRVNPAEHDENPHFYGQRQTEAGPGPPREESEEAVYR